jgi:16S rRNA (cytosine967-C5)-methyltransferase
MSPKKKRGEDTPSPKSNAPKSNSTHRSNSTPKPSSPPAEKKQKAGLRSRKLALEILLTVERENAYANLALAAAFRNNELSERDRGFVTALVQGVLRNRMSLDESISQLSTRPVDKLPAALKNGLRLGLFQLVFMPNLPPSAVLNTSTELAKTFGHQGLAKFTNGLLRNFLRRMDKERIKHNTAGGATPDVDGDVDSPVAVMAESTEAHSAAKQLLSPADHSHSPTDHSHSPTDHSHSPTDHSHSPTDHSHSPTDHSHSPTDHSHSPTGQSHSPTGQSHLSPAKEQPLEPQNEVSRLSTAFSMPVWIVDRWLKNFGREETLALLKFSQSTPVLEVRTNQMSITPEGLEQIFANEGIACHRGRLVDSCLIIEKGQRQSSPSAHKSSNFHGSPLKLPGYAEGLFSVQDEAAAFVSIVTDPKPGDVVIDLCAAPGGKTVHMGEMMDNHGRIIAVDVSETRLNLIKKARSRLELTNIETVAFDGRRFQFEQGADRVLLDAPCTGTGVLNRRSDMRYQRQPGDLVQLVELQRQLLTNAATLVKPGGILVYSTCSIEAEENFDNIRWFLQNFEAFEPDDFAPLLPEYIRAECAPSIQGPACKTEAEISRLHMVQLLPSRHGVSGFFIARLKRKH